MYKEILKRLNNPRSKASFTDYNNDQYDATCTLNLWGLYDVFSGYRFDVAEYNLVEHILITYIDKVVSYLDLNDKLIYNVLYNSAYRFYRVDIVGTKYHIEYLYSEIVHSFDYEDSYFHMFDSIETFIREVVEDLAIEEGEK